MLHNKRYHRGVDPNRRSAGLASKAGAISGLLFGIIYGKISNGISGAVFAVTFGAIYN